MRYEASVSLNRIVPLVRVCELIGVARSSFYAQRRGNVVAFPARLGPKTAYSDARLTEEIRAVLAASPFVGEGYRKVWAKLRYGGIRTSKARVLRLRQDFWHRAGSVARAVREFTTARSSRRLELGDRRSLRQRALAAERVQTPHR